MLTLNGLKHFVFKYYEITILLLAYSLSYFFILTNTGVFWDDWTVYNVSITGLEQQFAANGYHTFLAFLKFVFFIFGDENVFVYRFITFISYLAIGYLLLLILRKIKEIDTFSRLFLVLFFITFPVNSARISMVIVNHSLNYLLFFLGLWLFTVFLKKRNIIVRFISLLCLFLSFFTPSLLVFYIVVVFYLIYYYKGSLFKLSELIKITFRYVDFFILPILYWLFKKKILITSGLYADYNEIESLSLQSLIEYIKNDFFYSYIKVFNWALPNSLLGIILTVILFLLFLLILHKLLASFIVQRNTSINLVFILLGVLTFIAGTFAYLAVGKVPMLSDWNSRQQLLVPLGASFISYYGLKAIFDIFSINIKHRAVIYTLLLTLFIVGNMKIYYEFEKDWIKQQALMEKFESMEIFQEYSTFVFDDKTKNLNANDRVYRFYEYTGLFKKTFGDTSRLGQDSTIRKDLEIFRKYQPYVYFNIEDYPLGNTKEYEINIEEGTYKLNTTNYLRLKFNSVFNKDAYTSDLQKIVKLDVESQT